MKGFINTLREKGITKFNTFKCLYRLTHLKPYIESRNLIYIVYTLGKVGSQSIYLTLRDQIMETEVIHEHFLSEKWLNGSGFPLSKTPQRIKSYKKIKSALKNSSINFKIISLVRDPVAKTISQLFQTPEAFGLTEHILSEMEPAEICEFLIDKNQFLFFQHPCQWFDEEFLEFTGIDIYKTPFDYSSRKQSVNSKRFDILILRTEDLKSEDLVLKHLCDFTGKSITYIITGNETINKSTGKLHKGVKASIQFTADFLDYIYTSKYCRHFYTEKEINGFKQHWGSKRR